MSHQPRSFRIVVCSRLDSPVWVRLISDSRGDFPFTFTTEMCIKSATRFKIDDFECIGTFSLLQDSEITEYFVHLLLTLFPSGIPRFRFDESEQHREHALKLDNPAEFFASLSLHADEVPESWIS